MKPKSDHEANRAAKAFRDVVSESERRNEIPIAAFRIVIFLALLWLDFESGLSTHIADYLFFVVTVYGIGSVASLIAAVKSSNYRSLQYLFSFLDAASLAASISLIESSVGISRDHLMLLPMFSLIFIILIHSALRYDYYAVIFTAGVFFIVLFIIDVVLHMALHNVSEIDQIIAPHNAENVLLFARYWIMYRLTSISFVAISALILCFLIFRTRQMTERLLHREAKIIQLSTYFPPAVVRELEQQGQYAKIGRRNDTVVMFADIVGFTKIVESSSSDETIELLRNFHEIAESAVFENNGTLHKFLGDGMMATFGAPLESKRKATEAIASAFSMIADFEKLNGRRSETGLGSVRLSIGIHIGEAFFGQIGSARRMEYAVVGDVVNVASRLEAWTRNIEKQIVVSHEFINALIIEAAPTYRDRIDQFEPLGPTSLQGKSQPLEIWAWGAAVTKNESLRIERPHSRRRPHQVPSAGSSSSICDVPAPHGERATEPM